MFAWLRRLVTRVDHAQDFHRERAALLQQWFEIAHRAGQPKWMEWVGYEAIGEPHFVPGFALHTVIVQFEPHPESPMTDVPQSREPRSVVAVFHFKHGRWQTAGRAVFNLGIAAVAKQITRTP